jgi:type IV secretory pathway VirB4 component
VIFLLPYRFWKKIKVKKEDERMAYMNHNLLNLITPIGGLEFGRSDLKIGENLGRIYAVIQYPSTLDLGWASRISSLPNTILCQSFEPCDNSLLVEALSRSVSQNRMLAESSRDALKRQRAATAAEDAERLIMQIDRENQTVGYMTNLIMPVAKDELTLERLCRIVEGTVAAMKCKARVLATLQKESFMALSPYHPIIGEISNMAKRNVPFSTYIGGFPFASAGYSDREGVYFSQDGQGGLVVLDPWKREADRTNSNWVIMGVPGTGKSATSKHVLISEFMMGTKIIVIDVEREYRDLCRNLEGDWVDTAGGGGGMINPLQIRPNRDDGEDGKEEGAESGMSHMALHFKTLDIFFGLYMPEMTDKQKVLLNMLMEQLYQNFGIHWNTDVSACKAQDFPIMSDLFALIYDAYKKKQTEDLAYLMSMIRELAEGADRYLFNGHTTLQTNSRFIVLDTSAIHSASDKLKRAQYFNLLTWAWEQMSQDRAEKVLLACDEAYTLVDPQVPQSLVFLRNIAKRARKYEAGIMIISHSVTDFLAPEVKMYGQALLDLPTYKVLFGTDGKNLAETAELYHLTEAEQDYLIRKERKTAILMVGSKRLAVRFELPPYKLQLMGSGGGR